MKLRKAIGIVTTLIAAIGLACVMHLVPKRQEIALSAMGMPGLSVEGFAMVDGEWHELSGELPQSWSFTASDFEFQLRQTEPQSEAKIRVTLSARDEPLWTVEEQSVQQRDGMWGLSRDLLPPNL